MLEVITISNLMTFGWVIAGMIIGFLMLRIRDKLIGVDKNVFKTMLENPVAAALYFGLTGIAVFLYMGLAVS